MSESPSIRVLQAPKQHLVTVAELAQAVVVNARAVEANARAIEAVATSLRASVHVEGCTFTGSEPAIHIG